MPEDAARLYQLLVRELDDYAIFMIDPQGVLQSWNAGVEKVLGFREEDFIGRPADMIFTPEDRLANVPKQEMDGALQSGRSSDVRWHIRKDGSLFFANGIMAAIRDDQGELIGFAKVLHDETERKNLENRLLESNASLERFGYAVAHDLQEPLRTISSYVDLLGLRNRAQLDAHGLQFLEYITEAAERMRQLIRALLSYSRMAGESHPVERLRLDDALQAALSSLNAAIEESSAVITYGSLPVVNGVSTQIIQVFQNLIGNAMKYAAPGRSPTISIAADRKGGDWVIAVKDNGIGFEMAYANKIFDPFFRMRAQAPGTGIGLSLCKRTIEAHGGRIWAESVPGEGTTFFFTLPVLDEAEP